MPLAQGCERAHCYGGSRCFSVEEDLPLTNPGVDHEHDRIHTPRQCFPLTQSMFLLGQYFFHHADRINSV